MRKDQNIAVACALLLVFSIWGVNGVYLSALSGIGKTAFWLADLAQWILVPCSLLALLAYRFQVDPAAYGLLYTGSLWRLAAHSTGASISLYCVFVWVRHWIWLAFDHPQQLFMYTSGIYPDGVLGKLIWVYSAVTAGFIESIFFIGLPWLLWRQASQSKGVFIAAISLVFALVHWEQGIHTVIAALSFSLVACVWYFRVNSLWPLIISHTVIDLIVLG